MKYVRPAKRFIATLIAGLTLALSVCLVFSAVLALQEPVAPHQVLKARRTEKVQRSSLEKMAASLLTDSIVSIVQSYYVDPVRVENRSLLETALSSLETSPKVRTGLSGDQVWIEVGDRRKVFSLGKDPDYGGLLQVLDRTAELLEGEGIAPAGDFTEKNPPGTVILLSRMLAALDAHSALMSPEAYRELRQGTEGSFGGLGVLVGIRDHLLTVIKPLERSPAVRAGIRRHDKIMSIEGRSTFGYTLDELVEYMRGDPGSSVNLSVLREGAESPQELTLKREIIRVDSVNAKDVSRKGVKVLHLAIENFSSRTSREVLTAIKRFRIKHKNKLNGLVLDLRSNPGGLLDQAVQVADLFLESGVIVTTKGRREEVETAGSGFDEVDFPMVVLIDGDSASASEIVAGALQDHGRAVVIGQPSFGKGSVQTIFELPGERALKLTIARYYTPLGRSIQNVGIMPDVWLQPLYERDENDNLFGPYRYQNEGFLKNHLVSEHGATVEGKNSALKAYYLIEPIESDTQENSSKDPELDAALIIIGKVAGTYGDHVPKSARRASHWLGLAGPALSYRARDLTAAARRWLRRKHDIDWLPGPMVNHTPDVQLEVVPEEGTAVPGEEMTLNWTLRNVGDTTADRLSLFVRSDSMNVETKEVLVGFIRAGDDRHGRIDVPLASTMKPGLLTLRVGVAVDAWPARTLVQDVVIEVIEKDVADLSAKVDLVDERGGQVKGILESREKARIKVTLLNQGLYAARSILVSLVNLAGKQVRLGDEPVAVERLEPGESVEVYVDIEGAETLYNAELGLGLHVESKDLATALMQRVGVRGLPNEKGKRAANSFVH